MKFEYTGRHVEVTPAMRSHVEEHFDKLDYLFDRDADHAHIIIEVERGKHRSEMIVKWRKEILTATSMVDDMYQSLSQTIDKIEKQARRLKNKITDKHHKAEKISTVQPPVEEELQFEDDTPRIIESDLSQLKPMTPEEATMMLEDEDNQFFVFRNAANEKIAVIYKRKDGNYGLIQP